MEFVTGVKKKETLELSELLEEGRIGTEVKVNGAIHTIRDMGTIAFIILRKREGLVQCVYEENISKFDLKDVKEADTVEVTGVLAESAKAPNGIEIRLGELKILSEPAEPMPLPIAKWKLNTSLEAKLNYRPISLRNIRERAKFRIQEGIVRGFRDFLYKEGFTEIHTPKIGAKSAEGGANLFRLEYFHRPAILQQSPQFYKQMLPSLNMCGFLYTGADLGGFGSDTTRELLLRFLALGVFTPLMRNHSATGTREQECYQFEKIEDFRAVINTRYRLVPYLYSEYMKAVLNDDMYFKPLGFVYPDDKRAIRIEDQLMLGNEIMIAPVYEQNARGRYVYLPEEMKFIKFLPDGSISEEVLAKGIHYVDVALNEVPLFIRSGKCIPVAEAAECVKDIDTEHLQLIGYKNSSYTMYEDDGIHKDYDKEENYRVFTN